MEDDGQARFDIMILAVAYHNLENQQPALPVDEDPGAPRGFSADAGGQAAGPAEARLRSLASRQSRDCSQLSRTSVIANHWSRYHFAVLF